MNILKLTRVVRVLAVSLLFTSAPLIAQDDAAEPNAEGVSQPSVSAEAQANNPLADFRAFNVHNYYIPELSGPTDETANNTILRYAHPFGNWLMRSKPASIPITNTEVARASASSAFGANTVTLMMPLDGYPVRGSIICEYLLPSKLTYFS